MILILLKKERLKWLIVKEEPEEKLLFRIE